MKNENKKYKTTMLHWDIDCGNAVYTWETNHYPTKQQNDPAHATHLTHASHAAPTVSTRKEFATVKQDGGAQAPIPTLFHPPERRQSCLGPQIPLANAYTMLSHTLKPLMAALTHPHYPRPSRVVWAVGLTEHIIHRQRRPRSSQ